MPSREKSLSKKEILIKNTENASNASENNLNSNKSKLLPPPLLPKPKKVERLQTEIKQNNTYDYVNTESDSSSSVNFEQTMGKKSLGK